MVNAYTTMNFHEDELDGIWSSTAAPLLMGELEIDDSAFDNKSK